MIKAISALNSSRVSFGASPINKVVKNGIKIEKNITDSFTREAPKGLTTSAKKSNVRFDDADDYGCLLPTSSFGEAYAAFLAILSSIA